METKYNYKNLNRLFGTIKAISMPDNDYTLVSRILRRPYQNNNIRKEDINIVLGRLPFNIKNTHSFHDLHDSFKLRYNLVTAPVLYGIGRSNTSLFQVEDINSYMQRKINNYLRIVPKGNFRRYSRARIIRSGFKCQNLEYKNFKMISNFVYEAEDIKNLSFYKGEE